MSWFKMYGFRAPPNIKNHWQPSGLTLKAPESQAGGPNLGHSSEFVYVGPNVFLVDVSDIFYFFLLGEGEGGVRGARPRGRGRFFFLKSQEGGGVSRGGGGAGGCLSRIGEFFLGGGVNIFFRGRNVHQVLESYQFYTNPGKSKTPPNSETQKLQLRNSESPTQTLRKSEFLSFRGRVSEFLKLRGFRAVRVRVDSNTLGPRKEFI